MERDTRRDGVVFDLDAETDLAQMTTPLLNRNDRDGPANAPAYAESRRTASWFTQLDQDREMLFGFTQSEPIPTTLDDPDQARLAGGGDDEEGDTLVRSPWNEGAMDDILREAGIFRPELDHRREDDEGFLPWAQWDDEGAEGDAD